MLLTNAKTTLIENADKADSMPKNKIRVLIVDDHPGVRIGIKNLLGSAKDIKVVGEGSTGAEALELVKSKQADILLLDIELPDQRGDLVMRTLHTTYPHMKVLAVSSYTDHEYINGMAENGAMGYLTKDEAPVMLVDAIRKIVNKGRKWFGPQALKNSDLLPIEEQMLTKREVDILTHLVKGESTDEIAQALGMDSKQVGKYLEFLMRKFETDSLATLTEIAERVIARQNN